MIFAWRRPPKSLTIHRYLYLLLLRATIAIPERACASVCETEDGCDEVSLERREERARVSENVE